jgi:predicted CXXCH cytochrome family protein
MKRLFSVLFILAAFAGMLVAQPTSKIKVVGVPDKFKSKNANIKTTGLKNVGKGERVVLQAWAIAGTAYADTILTATSAGWGWKSKPTGSTATIADTGATNQLFVYFVPDLVGTYEIEMTATTAELGPVATTSVKITAGTYKGVGVYNLTTGAYDNFGCSPCHTATGGEHGDFVKTNHASALARKMNETGGHFGNSCLPCHSAGSLGGTPVPDNNNFEKIRTTVGWNVPVNGPNTYEDSLVAAQPALALLSGIQCENCHGPVGQHYGPGINVDKNLRSEVCAPCHFSSDRHPKGYSWDASLHANSFAEGKEWSYMNRSGCSQCHTGNGYVEAFNNIPGATTGRYDDPVAITCAACHDPHDNTNQYQLRRASVADACTGCHETRMSSRGLHHSHQGPMVFGTEAIPFPGFTPGTMIGFYSGWQLPGYVYENGSHSEIEERCAACHMAPTPTYDPTYATPDTLLNRVGGHTFAVKWDGDTPDDPSDDVLNYVGCKECHGVVTLEFVELTQAKTHKLLDTLATLLPKGTNGLPLPPRDATLTQLQAAASYNYYFVDYDGSYGAHNFKYVEGLLKSSIEQLKLGQGSASIVSVSDIPNDQGKQVQLVWNQFPAESFAYDRLVKYGIWRMDPSFSENPVKKFRSLSDIFTSAPVGGTVTNGPVVWTFVAEVPASGLAEYAYVAPTLYDTTITSGMVQTTFMIAGYTGDGKRLYASAADSGFSVDNLKPVKPVGLMAAYQSGGVVLSWAAPTDPDVDVYNVFRSTTAGFDPSTTAPIASVKGITYTDNAVTPGTQYYYRIGAVDFGGNVSPFSDETGVVTGIKTEQGIPTDFALKQNYPNPFNPSTEIAFALPKAVRVKLSIFTITGEQIATLVDREMAAGNYSVTWNGEGLSGRLVSSGLYLYRIEAGDFVSVRKMVMLK